MIAKLINRVRSSRANQIACAVSLTLILALIGSAIVERIPSTYMPICGSIAYFAVIMYEVIERPHFRVITVQGYLDRRFAIWYALALLVMVMASIATQWTSAHSISGTVMLAIAVMSLVSIFVRSAHMRRMGWMLTRTLWVWAVFGFAREFHILAEGNVAMRDATTTAVVLCYFIFVVIMASGQRRQPSNP